MLVREELSTTMNRMAKMNPPGFSGKMKDYPSFREDWQGLVTNELEDHEQRILIRIKVPEKDKINLAYMSNMAEVWIYLDNKYGKHDILV